jgi:ParB-like chromosome segregation protein Spo0J
MTTTGLRIEHLAPGDLKPWARNARKHSRKQLRQIADSIREFGFTSPVLIDEVGTILAGHGRVEAAQLIGMATVPCVRIEHMTATQKRAYTLADNKLALNATWDEELLAEELAALASIDPGFDLGITGFDIAEVDSLLSLDKPEEDLDPRDDAIPANALARVQLGDIWQMGRHLLICGDSLERPTGSMATSADRAS